MPRRSVTEIFRGEGILPLREGTTNRDFCKCLVYSVACIWILMNVLPRFYQVWLLFLCCTILGWARDFQGTVSGKKEKPHVQLNLCQAFSFKIPENFYSLLNLSLGFLFMIKYQHFVKWAGKFAEILQGN